MLFIEVPALGDRLGPDTSHVSVSHFLIDALALSAVLFFGFVVVGLAALYTVPRLLNLAITPDKPYPLYGFQYAAHRMISQMTNIRFYAWLFGDSSFIVHYLRGLGYNLSRVEQTGSNFGTEVKHESPYLVSVGRGRWWPTGCPSSTPNTRARPSRCPGRRSDRTTSSATTSCIRRAAGRARTACWPRR